MLSRHQKQARREKKNRKAKERQATAKRANTRKSIMDYRALKAQAYATKANRRLPESALRFVIEDKIAFRRFIASCKADRQRTSAASAKTELKAA
jgi:hypothetical protein